MKNWQPIETAPIPKEESSFENAGYSPYVLIVGRDKIVRQAHTINFIWFEVNEPRYSIKEQPTHWMPLPEIPVDLKKGEVSEVERALEKLKQAISKSLGKITCVNDVNKITSKLMDVREAAQNLVNALKNEKKVTQEHYDLEAVTRLEIIDSNGRSYVNLHANPMEFSYQDNGKTLKIFCGNKEDMSKPEPKIDMKEERVEPVSIWKEF